MKVVLLLSDYYINANIGLKSFLETSFFKRHDIEISGIILADQFNLSPRGLKRTVRYFRKMKFLFFLKQVVINVWKQVKIFIGRYFLPYKKRKYYGIRELAEQNDIPFKEVGFINSKEAKTFIKNCQPDLLVSCFLLEILKKPVLNLAPMGGINVHPGLVQQHRGTFSAFWALLKNWRMSGATVHYMTEKVDEGEIILQKKCLIRPGDTVHSVNERTAKLGGKLLAKAIVKIKKKNLRKYHLKKLGQLFSVPTPAQIREFYAKRKSMINWREMLGF